MSTVEFSKAISSGAGLAAARQQPENTSGEFACVGRPGNHVGGAQFERQHGFDQFGLRPHQDNAGIGFGLQAP